MDWDREGERGREEEVESVRRLGMQVRKQTK